MSNELEQKHQIQFAINQVKADAFDIIAAKEKTISGLRQETNAYKGIVVEACEAIGSKPNELVSDIAGLANDKPDKSVQD